jgi:hypothetical protein
MIPASKVGSAVKMEFETAGLGEGNRTIDWTLQAAVNRLVLLDVKTRSADFIKQMEKGAGKATDPPAHDPKLLFRSIEHKFLSSDPSVRLQGLWISTNIKQPEKRLHTAFMSLDGSKVHFAILGDWKPDAYLLVRREQDRTFLVDLFQLQPSTRFTFAIEYLF